MMAGAGNEQIADHGTSSSPPDLLFFRTQAREYWTLPSDSTTYSRYGI